MGRNMPPQEMPKIEKKQSCVNHVVSVFVSIVRKVADAFFLRNSFQ